MRFRLDEPDRSHPTPKARVRPEPVRPIAAAVLPWAASRLDQADARLDPGDDVFRRRGPGGEPHHPRGVEPFRAYVRVGLDVMHAGAVAGAGRHQLARVVAGPAAHHDHHVHVTCHLDGRRLAVLGGLAYGVDEAHLRARESLADEPHQVPYPLDRLRRLSGHAEPWMLG